MNPQRANQPLSTLYSQFDQKLDFCQSCLTITHQLLESLETDDGDLVLQLLKRRDTVFHRIRRLDNEISSSQLKSLLDQIEQKIHQMMKLDVQIHQKIRENHVQARNQIGQAQTQQKIARAYRIAGAKPASLLDLNE